MVRFGLLGFQKTCTPQFHRVSSNIKVRSAIASYVSFLQKEAIFYKKHTWRDFSSSYSTSNDLHNERTLQVAKLDNESLSQQLLREQEELLALKYSEGVDPNPLTESELKTMYAEILSLSKDVSTGHFDHPDKLKNIIDRLEPVLFSKEDNNPHLKLLSKVEKESERNDIIHQALIVSRELGQKHLSLHIFNLLLYLHSLEGQAEEASKVFEIISEMGIVPNEKTYCFLMNAYANQKNLKKTIETFNLMKEKDFNITSNSYAILLKAYSLNGLVDDAFGVYEVMKKNKIELHQPVFSTLLGACIKNNQLSRAWATFEYMRLNHCQADVVSFTLMLSACAKNAEAEKALNLFEEMSELGIIPNIHTFNALLSACSERSDYYATSLEILDRMTEQFGFSPDLYTLNTLLYAAQMSRKLEDARKLFSKVIRLAEGTEDAKVAYTNLFYGYSKAFKPSLKENNFLECRSQKPDPNLPAKVEECLSILTNPLPKTNREAIVEARLIMLHMDRVFQSNSDIDLTWPRASYLTIHTNYGNFIEAVQLFETYYTNPGVKPHFTIYINMLRMCFLLKKHDYFKVLWAQVEPILSPLKPKSTLSPLEKKLYKKDHGLTTTLLIKFYRSVVNGLARFKELDLCFELLEDMSRDSDLKTGMDLKLFPTLYQAVLMTGDPHLKLRLFKLCPDPKEDPIVSAKYNLAKKWKQTSKSRPYYEIDAKKRFIEKELIEDSLA